MCPWHRTKAAGLRGPVAGSAAPLPPGLAPPPPPRRPARERTRTSLPRGGGRWRKRRKGEKIKKKRREERGKVPGCQGQARPVGCAEGGWGRGAESQRRDARRKPALPAKKGRLHPNFPAPARPSRPGKAGRGRRGTRYHRRQENKPEGKVKRQAAAGSGDGGEPG